jgi:hypothetical protein
MNLASTVIGLEERGIGDCGLTTKRHRSGDARAVCTTVGKEFRRGLRLVLVLVIHVVEHLKG